MPQEPPDLQPREQPVAERLAGIASRPDLPAGDIDEDLRPAPLADQGLRPDLALGNVLGNPSGGHADQGRELTLRQDRARLHCAMAHPALFTNPRLKTRFQRT